MENDSVGNAVTGEIFVSTTCIEMWDHQTVVLSCFSASEIQMMTLPPGQFVITDSGVATPVTTGQVKAVTPVSCAAWRVFLFPCCTSPVLLPNSSPPKLFISELEVYLLFSHNILWYCVIAQLISIIGSPPFSTRQWIPQKLGLSLYP